MNEMNSAQRAAAEQAAKNFAYQEESEELRIAQGTNPNIKIKTQDTAQDFEVKSILAGLDKAAVMAKSEKDEWDNAIDAARKQVARDGETPIKSRAELQAEKDNAAHRVDVEKIKAKLVMEEDDKAWQDAKQVALAKHAAAEDTLWDPVRKRQKTASLLERTIGPLKRKLQALRGGK